MSRMSAIIALLSMSLLGLELTWTRILSAEFYYTFAFLILSLAILGLGLGALAVRLSRSSSEWEGNLDALLLLTAMSMLGGPPLVFMLHLRVSLALQGGVMAGKLLLATAILTAPFFLGGVTLALLFREGHDRMPRLYASDLAGAGLGVILAIPVMNGLGTPAAAFCCALPVLAAAGLAARGWGRALPLGLAVLMAVLASRGGELLQQEREERAPVSSTHWDAAAKIKIYDYDENYRGINIDNLANSPVYGFDGNWDRPDSLAFEFGIDVSYLIGLFDSCTFLSLGAGGGGDVLQALQAGATEIHAVEVVPYVNELMSDGALAEFSGNIYHDPRVIVATEDARAYVRRFRDKFDVIYSLSSNSFAALASGAFALAENYLFTTEAFGDYWRALTDDGFMMMEHQFYMPRLVSELMDALAAEGVSDPAAHFAVYDLPQMRRNMVLISKRPLTDEIRTLAFGRLTPETFDRIHLLYPAADSLQDNLVNRIVLHGWRSALDSARVDISPCTDDRPYTAQLGLWENFSWKEERPYEFTGFPLAKATITAILLVAGVLILPLNLLPYLRGGERLRAAPWIYFFLIGTAFMCVEVVLIQKYTLFIGPSAYSVAAILLTLLLAAGMGSRMAGGAAGRLAFPGILAWLLLEIFLFRSVTTALAPQELPLRILVTVVLVAPLGFFMGMPFPLGGLRAGRLVDWGLAVNGAASVIGATLAVLVAITSGFRAALLLSVLLYLGAWILYSRRGAWTSPGECEKMDP